MPGRGAKRISNAEAASIASEGFDVVRLGIFRRYRAWHRTHERPGHLLPRQAEGGRSRAIRSQDLRHVYAASWTRRSRSWARHGVYSLVEDASEDAMNKMFARGGIPNWAVCTDGIAPVAYRQRGGLGREPDRRRVWRRPKAISGPNDVVGNLQGAYDQIWARSRARMAGNPWVIGYIPVRSSPFSRASFCTRVRTRRSTPKSSASPPVRAHPGKNPVRAVTITDCPPDDPETGMIPAIRHGRSPSRCLLRTRHDHQRSGPEPHRADGILPPRLQLPRLLPLHVPNGPEPPITPRCAPRRKSRCSRTGDRTASTSLTGAGRTARVVPHGVRGHDGCRRPRGMVADADATSLAGCTGSGSITRILRDRTDSGLWPAGPAPRLSSMPFRRRTRRRWPAPHLSCSSTSRRQEFRLGYRVDHTDLSADGDLRALSRGTIRTAIAPR